MRNNDVVDICWGSHTALTANLLFNPPCFAILSQQNIAFMMLFSIFQA